MTTAPTTRRGLFARLGLLVAGGAMLFLLRDRLPWPPLEPLFADGRATPWIPLEKPGLIDIPAQIGGFVVRAVVDTGAQFTAVDAALAERLSLSRTFTAPLLAYGVSGQPRLTHTVSLDLALPGLSVAGVRAAALDLAAISAATGRDFQMLIGRDVLSRLVVDADFPRRRVRFLTPIAFKPARGALVLPLSMRAGPPTLPVRIEDAPPLDLLLDTGASGWVALSEASARERGLLAPGRAVSRTHSVGLGGFSVDRLVRAERVAIGPILMQGVEVQVYAPAIHAPAPSGLIGVQFLQGFRAGLDLPGRRLVLERPGLTVVPGTIGR